MGAYNTLFTRIISLPFIEKGRADRGIDYIWRRNSPKCNLSIACSCIKGRNTLLLVTTFQCLFSIVLISLCCICGGRSDNKEPLSIFKTSWYYENTDVGSYPLSINLLVKVEACSLMISVSVQFLWSLINWLCGTALSHDWWWQLSTGIEKITFCFCNRDILFHKVIDSLDPKRMGNTGIQQGHIGLGQ